MQSMPSEGVEFPHCPPGNKFSISEPVRRVESTVTVFQIRTVTFHFLILLTFTESSIVARY